MYKQISGIIVLACSIAFSQSLYADDSYCRQGLHKMVESLNLTQEQKTQITPILENMKTTIKENSAQMRDLETQMKTQANSETMDQTAIDGLVDRKTALVGNLMKARFSAQNQISAILTPEQKTKLHSAIQAEEEKMVTTYKACHSDD